MELFSALLQFEDTRGELVTVRKPSILDAEEFRHRFNDLSKDLEKPHLANASFQDSYSKNKKFRRKVNYLLELVHIEPERLSLDTIVQLLFSHNSVDENGEEVFIPQGALLQFIFGKIDKDGLKHLKKEEVQEIATVIGQLWASLGDFNETMDVLKTLSAEDLNSVLNARNWALLPAEEKMKRNQQKASQKLLQNLRAGKLKAVEGEVSSEALSDDEVAKFFA